MPIFWQVDSLQAKLLEKLEQSLVDLQLKMEEITNASVDSNDPSKQGNVSELISPSAHEVSTKSNTILVLNLCLVGCERWLQMRRKLFVLKFNTNSSFCSMQNCLKSVDLI